MFATISLHSLSKFAKSVIKIIVFYIRETITMTEITVREMIAENKRRLVGKIILDEFGIPFKIVDIDKNGIKVVPLNTVVPFAS